MPAGSSACSSSAAANLLLPPAGTQVPLAQLAETEEVQVRAWDDTMNTQPER